MSPVQHLSSTLDCAETATLLHALKHYENYWSALVLNADHISDPEIAQKMVRTWREARKLRVLVEREIEGHHTDRDESDPDPMAIY